MREDVCWDVGAGPHFLPTLRGYLFSLISCAYFSRGQAIFGEISSRIWHGARWGNSRASTQKLSCLFSYYGNVTQSSRRSEADMLPATAAATAMRQRRRRGRRRLTASPCRRVNVSASVVVQPLDHVSCRPAPGGASSREPVWTHRAWRHCAIQCSCTSVTHIKSQWTDVGRYPRGCLP